MDLETFGLIRNISSFSVLLPLTLFAIAFYKKNQAFAVKALGALLLVAGLADFLSIFLYTQFKINANPIISGYVLSQFVILSLIYRNAYTSPVYKRITQVVGVLFIIFAIVNFCFIQGVKGFNSYSFAVSAAVFIIHAFLFSHQLLIELPEKYVERTFMFWINSAVFFYFGTNLYLFITVDQMIYKQDINQFLLSWGMHNGANTLKNLMFSIAIYMALEDQARLHN